MGQPAVNRSGEEIRIMRKSIRLTLLVAAIIASSAVPSGTAWSEEAAAASDQGWLGMDSESLSRGFDASVDIVLLRPLGFARLVGGAAALVPASIIQTLSLPFDYDMSRYQELAEIFVVDPYSYVFDRSLGDDFAR